MTGCVQARKYPPYFKIQQSINFIFHFPKRQLFSCNLYRNAVPFTTENPLSARCYHHFIDGKPAS